MKILGGFIILIYMFVILFIIAALIYVIIRRVEDHDSENFEKRDN